MIKRKLSQSLSSTKMTQQQHRVTTITTFDVIVAVTSMMMMIVVATTILPNNRLLVSAFTTTTTLSSIQHPNLHRSVSVSSSLYVLQVPSDGTITTASSSRSRSSSYSPTSIQQQQRRVVVPSVPFDNNIQSWCTGTVLPVISAALLITGNTVGAGCLVIPQLVVSLGSNGIYIITILYTIALVLNLISALVLAEVAITQKEQQQHEQQEQQQYDSSSNNHNNNNEINNNSLPTSFQEFASVNLQSSTAGYIVSCISFFVNACILAFDFNRFGITIVNTIQQQQYFSTTTTTIIGHNNNMNVNCIAILCATVVSIIMTSLSSTQLSTLCNIFVAVLFISFGGLLLPGLANIASSSSTTIATTATAAAAMDVVTTTTTTTTTTATIASTMSDMFTPDIWNSISSIFPIVLMSMIFQNIVPVVVKHMKYHRNMSVAAITLGSLIPYTMYLAWCYTCIHGGIDINTYSPLITIFSIATLAGSSLCTSMSLVEELDTVIPKPRNFNDIPLHDTLTTNKNTDNGSFSPYTTIPSVAIPLIAALLFGGDNSNSCNCGLTGALTIAGSLGSPLLYGFLPALMAWQQRQPQDMYKQSQQQYLIPSSALPVLGLLSTGFVGQEMISRFTDFVSVATA